MQLIPREMLFDIMAHKKPVKFKSPDSLQEDDENASVFQTFMTSANRIYNESNGQMDVFNDDIYYFMKENKKNVKYVGEGSSRVVYALVDGTALKVAKTDAGKLQNQVEVRHCMNPVMHYDIFPDFYEADKRSWLALNCELCSKAKKEDFTKLFQLQLEPITDVIEYIVKNNIEDWELDKAKDYFNNTLGRPGCGKFVEKLIAQRTKPFKLIHSLIEFYRDYGLEELILGDVESEANWGITFRDNEEVLVIIDAGFNENVYNLYYK